MKKIISMCCFIIVSCICQTVYANTLYMTDGSSPRSTTETSWLYSIDTESMVITPIGDVGFHVADLAWDPTSGTLYAATSIHDPVHIGLIKINTNTGVSTPIGIKGWGKDISGTGVREDNKDIHVAYIDIDSSGNMFGAGKAVETNGSLLLKINKNNGTFSFIGVSHISDDPLNGNQQATGPMFIDGADKLWVAGPLDSLLEMETVTGIAPYSLDFVNGQFVAVDAIRSNINSKSHGTFDKISGTYWDVETFLDGIHFINKYDVSGGEVVESFLIPNGEIIDYSHKQPALAFAYENTLPSDIDSDGVPDDSDNCTEVANTNQFDSDGDGYGNMCDPDIDNDGRVDEWDWYLAYGFSEDYDPYEEDDGDDRFRDYYLADADINGDGLNDNVDRQLFDDMNDQFGPSAFH